MPTKLYRSTALLLLLLAGMSQHVFAQSGFFEPLPTNNARIDDPMAQHIKKLTYYTLKEAQLRKYLADAPLEFTKEKPPVLLEIPLPGGGTEVFEMFEVSILAPEIAAKHPEMKSYRGYGQVHREASIRIGFTTNEFSAIILGIDGDAAYYEKVSRDASEQMYRVYLGEDVKDVVDSSGQDRCNVVRVPTQKEQPTFKAEQAVSRMAAGTNDVGDYLRTFRLAMVATTEFVEHYGGRDEAYKVLFNYFNQVSEIYLRELSVNFSLVTDRDTYYTTKPIFGDGFDSNDRKAMQSQSQDKLDGMVNDGIIGYYHIGHVLGRNETGGFGSGRAEGELCSNESKAKGVSNVGDVNIAKLIAHEMGHQFGMDHTFSSCGAIENANAVEPGSGTTIMSYGFDCPSGGDYEPFYKLFLHFHTRNYEQAIELMTKLTTCGVSHPTGNSIPVITSITSDKNIPKSTPFFMTGEATDANGDALTYSWEGTNTGEIPTGNSLTDPSRAPFFRSYEPVSTGIRIYPRLSAILGGTNTAIGDKLPSIAFTTTHRLTIRDNKGGVTFREVNVKIASNSGPFLETTNLSGSYPGNSTQTITWDVANTTAAPVSCDKVDILLSTDGGMTFPTILADDTPNDGSQSVTLPAVLTSQARIKIASSNNIFFDISNHNFNIVAPPPQKVNVVFLIDDTGSMAEEINGVKNNLARVFDWLSEPVRRDKYKDYVYQLCTYKDGVTLRPPTKDLNMIRTQVAALYASGGDDCPEASVEALEAILENLADNSIVYHATDASPHDGTGDRVKAIATVMRGKDARMQVLLSGDCISSSGGRTSSIAGEMESIIPFSDNHDTRGGRVGRVSATNDVPLSAIDVFSFLASETGGVYVFLPDVNSSDPIYKKLYENIGYNIIVGAFEPAVTHVAPYEGPAGSVVAITVHATKTNFNGSTTLSFDDPNITVQSVTLVSPTKLTALIQVGAGTSLGLKGIVATTSDERAEGVGVFNVVNGPAQPTVVSIAPSTGKVGETLTVTVTGINTNWSGSSVLAMGSGITVMSTSVKNGQQLMAQIKVSSAATLGYRNVTVTTGAEVAAENVVGPFLVIESAVDCSTMPTITAGLDKVVYMGYEPGACTTLSVGGIPEAEKGNYTYLWSTGSTEATTKVCPETNSTYNLIVTNSSGCEANASVKVSVVDVRCGNKNQSVKICYYGVMQCVSEKVAERYLKLGAKLGDCNSKPARMGSEEQRETVLVLTIKAYPNPMKGEVMVEVLSPTAGTAQFEVLDMAGRTIRTKSEELSSGVNEVTFDLRTQVQGVYLIRCTDSRNNQAIVRVSKQ